MGDSWSWQNMWLGLDVHGMLVNVEPLALVKNYAYISAHKFMIINLDIKDA